MVSIDNICVEFSARPLLTDVSFVVNQKDRIALVGKNGAGKSTMLKIIAGMPLRRQRGNGTKRLGSALYPDADHLGRLEAVNEWLFLLFCLMKLIYTICL